MTRGGAATPEFSQQNLRQAPGQLLQQLPRQLLQQLHQEYRPSCVGCSGVTGSSWRGREAVLLPADLINRDAVYLGLKG